MIDGIINVYKEKGYTSHDVVAILRGVFKQKKIGHTGTLDPDAVGVLPICLGKGTKVAGLITDNHKTYRTTFVLGTETDTQDASGQTINTMDYDVHEDRVRMTIQRFIGPILQVPPMYSALKVNGQKLYDLARAGQEIERKSRQVTIFDIEDIVIDLPFIAMTVSCSKGTYIRTLCRDIAEALGTCGHMTELERLSSGRFHKDTALTLNEIKGLMMAGQIEQHIISVDGYFSGYRPLHIRDAFETLLVNGNKLPPESIVELMVPQEEESYNVYNEAGDYMGIYEWSDAKQLLIPVKFFCIRKGTSSD